MCIRDRAEAARLYAEIPGVGCEHLTPENTLNCRAFRGRFMGGVYDFIVPPGFAEILLTFWKGGRMDKNQGYEIIQAVMLENGRGFVPVSYTHLILHRLPQPL